MLSFLGVVEALDLRNNQLAIRSTKSYKIGEKSKVRIQVPPGTGKVITVEVEVIERIPQDSRTSIYRTKVLTDLGDLEFRGDDPALRDKPRHAVNVRVRSRELPGFRATAIDFSRGGAQLVLEGPVEAGQQVTLHFDLDGFRLETLSVQAEIMWCKTEGSQPNAGVRFVGTSPAQDGVVAELAEFLGDRANGQLEDLLSKAKLLAPEAAPAPRREVSSSTQTAPVSSPQSAWLTLPLQAQVDGYTRNLNNGSLYLRLTSAGEDIHTLEFPNCHWLEDHHLGRCNQVVGLSSSRQTPLLASLQERLGPGSWKHYRLLSDDQQVLFELISRPCRA